MIVKEALVAVIGIPVDENLVEVAIIDQGLLGNQEYTKSHAPFVGKAAVDVLLSIWSQPDVTEGGYSVKYDRNAVKDRLVFLARKYDRADVIAQVDVVPTISSPQVW